MTQQTSRILLIEDDETLGYALKEYLQLSGFEVHWKKNGRQGLDAFEKLAFDLCIIDIMLPDLDGFVVARAIRNKESDALFVFLTARSLKGDKLKGFNIGADDYIVKPVDEEELVARIQAILRRAKKNENEVRFYKIGTYHFDFQNQQLVLGSELKQLTEKETILLKMLCDSRGELLSRQEVLKTVWQQNDYFTRRSMDVFVSRLRKYLSKDPKINIKNVYGSGFILEIED